MGPEAAINAVFYNQIQAIEDPAERERVRRPRSATEYAADIDILHLASELVVDAVIEPDDLRAELIRRFALAEGKDRRFSRAAQPDHARLARAHLAAAPLPFRDAPERQIAAARGGGVLARASWPCSLCAYAIGAGRAPGRDRASRADALRPPSVRSAVASCALGRSAAADGHARRAVRLGMGAGPAPGGARGGGAGGGRQPGRPRC